SQHSASSCTNVGAVYPTFASAVSICFSNGWTFVFPGALVLAVTCMWVRCRVDELALSTKLGSTAVSSRDRAPTDRSLQFDHSRPQPRRIAPDRQQNHLERS